MATYTPPASGDFVDGQPLSASKTLAGFTNFATAINGNIDTANHGSAAYDLFRFQRGAIREVHRTPVRNTIESFLVVPGPATTMLGSARNIYDSTHTAIRFFLHHASARVLITSNVNLQKGKHLWVAANIAYDITATMFVDGTDVLSVRRGAVVVGTTPAGGANRGLSFDLSYRDASLAQGAHEAWVRLDFSATTYGGFASDTNGVQWYGSGSQSVVEVSYK